MQLRDAGNTTTATGTTVYPFSAWHLCEFHLIVGNAGVGLLDLRMEGFTSSEVSAVMDTLNNTITTVSYVDMHVTMDDVIIYDTSGANWNTWVGDKGVSAVYPNAKGDVNDLDPDGKVGAVNARWYLPRVDTGQAGGEQFPTGYISALQNLTPHAEWDVIGATTNGVLYRGELADQKRGSAIAQHNSGVGGGETYTATAGQDILVTQYVSPPLAAQTISGTFKCYMMCRTDGGAQDIRSQIILRIVSNDGSVVRGVLYAGDTVTSGANPPSEWVSTTTTQAFPRIGLLPASLAAIGAITEGDRLVVEIGVRTHGGCTGADIRWIMGDDQTVDLAENETNTGTNFNPWIEFSNALVLSQQGNFDFVNEPVSPAGLSNNGNDPYSFAADRDATYVATSVDNERDLYNCSNISPSYATSGPIAIKSQSRKLDAGTRKLAHVYKTSGAEQASADMPLSTTYAIKETLLDVDATDSAVWTDAKVNALQIGPKARP
jgi:hypothetical protein